MRDSDIETLGKIVVVLEQYLPIAELELYKEYVETYEHLKSKNDKEKQRYQAKAEYHRETSRKWRQDNKEHHSAYQKEYHRRKTQTQTKLQTTSDG